MTKTEIIEGNKIIGFYIPYRPSDCSMSDFDFDNTPDHIVKKLKYNSNWKMLMEAVHETLRRFDPDKDSCWDEYEELKNTRIEMPIEIIFSRLVSLIKKLIVNKS